MKVNTTENETCVLCHMEVPIRKDAPIKDREFYLPGAGQLCFACYCDLQPDASVNNITNQLKTIYHVSDNDSHA